MDVVRWKKNGMLDPVGQFDQLQDEINRLFDFDRFDSGSGLFDRTMSPALDVIERDDDFVISCDLPGVVEKDVDVSIAENVLTIKGEKAQTRELKERKVYRRESWAGTFQRTLSLPKGVNPDGISALLSNGVLTITLPKREEVKPRQISVKVHS